MIAAPACLCIICNCCLHVSVHILAVSAFFFVSLLKAIESANEKDPLMPDALADCRLFFADASSWSGDIGSMNVMISDSRKYF